jgi:hypothetical protein
MRRRYGCGLAVIVLALAGCRPAWEVTISGAPGQVSVDAEVIESLADFAVEVEDDALVPLEQVLYEQGYKVIDEIVVEDGAGAEHRYEWAAVTDSAYWLDEGSLLIDGEVIKAATIRVESSDALAGVEASITDIAPTAALALGLPAPAEATGSPLVETSAEHVLLLFLDGFGYVRYTEAREAGLIPNLAALEPPLLGITTYPSITSVSSASVLTGAPPAVHGANRRGIRKTDTETLFDVVARAGQEGVAVEGEALPFNLRSADFVLSGDRDLNGSTDDNVLANALAVLDEGMPGLLYVHFHGIDDTGHTYGPGAPEEEEAIRQVDAAVGEILSALPPDTLVIIFADHGQHLVNESGRLGNHGHLIERDMLIPVFIIEPR